MVIGGHMVGMAEYRVWDAVIGHIYHCEHIGSSNRLVKDVYKRQARAIALTDVLCSLSLVASRQNYVKPAINEKGVISIKNGRHPVVEQMMRDDLFVANDTELDNGKNRVSIITGPNMAGKSTYMRQVALIVLMAQLGSFVPAQEANIGI